MNKHAAKTLRDIRDNIDRHWCEEDIASIQSDAEERLEAIPESKRDSEKAEALQSEISHLEALLEAYQQLSDAFSDLHIDEGAVA